MALHFTDGREIFEYNNWKIATHTVEYKYAVCITHKYKMQSNNHKIQLNQMNNINYLMTVIRNFFFFFLFVC